MSPSAEGATSPLASAWWLHPLLFAAYPVLFIFSVNIREQITLQPLLQPLAIAVIGAAILLAIAALTARLLGASPARGAVIATLLIVLFFTYGHVWSALKETIHLHRYLLTAWALIALVGIAAAVRTSLRLVLRATSFLNVLGLLLVVINLVPIGQLQVRTTASPVAEPGPSAGPLPGAQHDVWYLIFDRYAGQEGLDRIYGFDNAPFVEQLRNRGFWVADHSTANYLKTAHSLASSLNMDYLDPVELKREASAPDDWTPLYRALQGAYAVERFLKARGYEYLHLGLRRGATYTNSDADRVFLFSEQSEFSAVLSDTTLLASLEGLLGHHGPGTASLYGNQTLYQFDRFEELAQTGGPKFVFAHILLPHPPYNFNADGSWVSPEQSASRTEREKYLQQVQYANRRILALVDQVLAVPPGHQPIVIIQADEGPFPIDYEHDELGFAWLEASEDELLQKFSILNAMFLPGTDPQSAGLYPTITPVNSFRVVLNSEFGANLPLLPDQNWVFVDQRHIYDMVDVTELVPR